MHSLRRCIKFAHEIRRLYSAKQSGCHERDPLPIDTFSLTLRANALITVPMNVPITRRTYCRMQKLGNGWCVCNKLLLLDPLLVVSQCVHVSSMIMYVRIHTYQQYVYTIGIYGQYIGTTIDVCVRYIQYTTSHVCARKHMYMRMCLHMQSYTWLQLFQ